MLIKELYRIFGVGNFTYHIEDCSKDSFLHVNYGKNLDSYLIIEYNDYLKLIDNLRNMPKIA